MKKVITVIGSVGLVILVVYFSVNLYSNSKLNNVKERVIENNPEITKIEKINSIGQWGEWFSEYVLVVEIGGLNYRVWASDEGKITEKEVLSNFIKGDKT